MLYLSSVANDNKVGYYGGTSTKEINMGNWKDNDDGTSTFVGCGDSHDLYHGTVVINAVSSQREVSTHRGKPWFDVYNTAHRDAAVAYVRTGMNGLSLSWGDNTCPFRPSPGFHTVDQEVRAKLLEYAIEANTFD